jgi:hypothetical protein
MVLLQLIRVIIIMVRALLVLLDLLEVGAGE